MAPPGLSHLLPGCHKHMPDQRCNRPGLQHQAGAWQPRQGKAKRCQQRRCGNACGDDHMVCGKRALRG